MAFICPKCDTLALQITHSLHLPPDSRSDDIILQIVACRACRFRGIAIYEESRRGAEESWHHVGYMVPGASVTKLRSLIRQCPAPKDTRCACATHQTLGQTNLYHTWYPPDWVTSETSFQLRQTGR